MLQYDGSGHGWEADLDTIKAMKGRCKPPVMTPCVAALQRMKWGAAGLLGAALAGLALARWQGGEGAWGWLNSDF